MQENALPLTQSGTRAIAAGMVRTAVPSTPLDCAAVAVDIVDAVSRVVLVDVLGLDRDESRTVLQVLWGTK